MKCYISAASIFSFCFVILSFCQMSCFNATQAHRTPNLVIEENKREGTRDWLIKVPFDTCSYPITSSAGGKG
jgi:hypothetical protein